ncbi:helix-turn-helix domain-containing protein [Streptomyces sp. NPDC053367]|uniref:helix-turn-helix domain-containing protein n=1 Tax=Streptomyces sp. NPDC053367 TaxID=3365700 RepID=UPI0037D7AD94
MPPRRAITGRSQEPRLRFAEELRLLRAKKGMTLRDLADAVGWDASTLSRLENGHTLGGPEIAEALDQFYETPGLLLTLWELAMADPTQFKEQYRRYMVLEAEAMALSQYSVILPPGLLQTPGFVREALAAGGLQGRELEQQVDARLGRRILLESDDAPPFRVVLSEAVLHNSLRNPGDWREQLEHLVRMSERPNVTLQVLPLGTGLHGLVNSDVMFLRLLDGRTVAYAENDVWGELVEETGRVERLLRAYDAVRDLALSAAESRAFILRKLEEVPCEPST